MKQGARKTTKTRLMRHKLRKPITGGAMARNQCWRTRKKIVMRNGMNDTDRRAVEKNYFAEPGNVDPEESLNGTDEQERVTSLQKDGAEDPERNQPMMANTLAAAHTIGKGATRS
ncbi:unnamed protein product [Calypogeia fissa]